jgi:hypothetical protein
VTVAENLNNAVLRTILLKFAPDADVEGDGILGLPWLSTETFYRHTEEYVAPEKRLAYKYELERTFPGKKGVL